MTEPTLNLIPEAEPEAASHRSVGARIGLPLFNGDNCNINCPKLGTHLDQATCAISVGELSWARNPERGLRIFRSDECKDRYPIQVSATTQPERIKSTMELYADDALEALELKRLTVTLQSENTALLDTIAKLGARVTHLTEQCTALQNANTAMVNDRRANDLTLQVTEFHNAFGYPVRHKLTTPTKEEAALRLRLVTEEYIELIEAHGAPIALCNALKRHVESWINWQLGGPGFDIDLVEVADALGDIDFVNQGTRLTYGIPRQPVANEISRSNLAKKGGGVDERGKLRKPQDWVGPDIRSILRQYE